MKQAKRRQEDQENAQQDEKPTKRSRLAPASGGEPLKETVNRRPQNTTEDDLRDLGVNFLYPEAAGDIQPGPSSSAGAAADLNSSICSISSDISTSSDKKLKLTTEKDCPVRTPRGRGYGSPMLARRSLIAYEGPNHFDNLSDEVIIQILKHLPKVTLVKVALVCKRFRDISFDESLWRRLDLGLRSVPPGILGVVMQRGVNALRATKAIFQTPLFKTVTGFNYIKSCVKVPNKLQYLDLSSATIDLPSLEQLLSVCTRLRKLSLEHLEISETVCAGIGQNKSLTVLHLGMTRGITQDGMEHIITNCTRLEEVNLAWTEMPSGALNYSVSSFPRTLKRLNISGCRDSLRDIHIESLVNCYPNLVELDLSDALEITELGIQLIVRHLRQLMSLSLSRCYNVNVRCFQDIANMPRIRSLNIFGILQPHSVDDLSEILSSIELNQHMFSSIARPTIGVRRTSIWGLRVRD